MSIDLAAHDCVAQALGRLPAYLNRQRWRELVEVIASEIQELDDAVVAVVAQLHLDRAEGAQLDLIGNRVNEDRGGRADADYRAGIRIRIAVNRSRGLAEDVIRVARLVLASPAPAGTVELQTVGAAAASLAIGGTTAPDPAVVTSILAFAKATVAAGVRLAVTSSSVPDAETFRLAGTTPATTPYLDLAPICGSGFTTRVGYRYFGAADDVGSDLAFIADDRGTATRISQAEWADAVARGHHAVVHGCKTGKTSLADYFADYAGYSSPGAAITADIQYNRDIMVSEGLDPDGLGRTVYVFPQGKHQPNLTTAGDLTISNALDALGFVGGRMARVQNAIIVNGGWSGAARYLPIIGHSWSSGDEAGNVAAIISTMQDEIAAGRSVVLMFHEVRASPSANEHITSANLEAIVSAAATLVRAGSARPGRLTDLVYELVSYTSPVHIGY